MLTSSACVALLAVTVCSVYGQSVEKPLSFDAASVKPHLNSVGGGRRGPDGEPSLALPPSAGGLQFTAGRVSSAPMGVTARKMILEAYHLTPYLLSGGPGWLDSDRFDLDAKAQAANEQQLRQMLQTLLADRFQLVVRRETKEMPVYALVAAKNGTKLHEWKEGDPAPAFGSGGRANDFRDRGTMDRLVTVLSGPKVGRPLLDKTGLKGVYLFYFEWDTDDDFVSSVQEQLGLKLEPQKTPVEVFVIDRIEKPGSN